jgi:Family of unknown function (DUF6247)
VCDPGSCCVADGSLLGGSSDRAAVGGAVVVSPTVPGRNRRGSARSAAGCGMMGAMTAQPVDDYDPDDPVEILRVLPGGFHEQFLAEYDAAVADARRPEQYRELHHLLRLWRLRAVAYSDPGYADRLAAMQAAVRSGGRDGTPIEDVVPDWDEKVAAQRRRAGG